MATPTPTPTRPTNPHRNAATARAIAPARHLHGTADPTTLPHTCRCGARWSGSRTAHCATCHRTFSGVATFDRHRPGDCIDPTTLGMALLTGRAYDCWGHTGEDT